MAETELHQALRAGDLAQAGGLCQQALRSNPRDMQALYGLGLICLQSQQFAQAENVFARLVFFNVEAREADGWELSRNNRFTHSEAHIRTEAARCGLDVLAVESCVPRREHSAPVAGFAVALCKSA